MKNRTLPPDDSSIETRRRFLRLFGTAAALLPITAITGCSDDAPPAKAAQPADAGSSSTGNSSPEPQPTPQPEPEPAPAEATESAAEQTAGELPKVSLDDPTAKALGYKHDAANVDLQKYPQRGTPANANSYCRNCTLFQGAQGDEWGPCQLFPGKVVNANGWCSGYTPKAS